MKANVSDQYDFGQASPSQKPGFEIFYSKKNKAWFFHANGVDGKPILFSQAYQTAEVAEKGLQSVLKNIEKGRIFKRTEGKKFFLSVVAGNHQEVGRSMVLDGNMADSALSFLKQVAGSNNPMVSKEPEAVSTETTTTATTAEYKPIRRYFRIYFYKNGDDGNQLKGRIEDIGDESSGISFQGIDSETIIGFMRQQLDGEFDDKLSPSDATTAPISDLQEETNLLSASSSSSRVASRIVQPSVERMELTPKAEPISVSKPLKIKPMEIESQKVSLEKNINNRATPSVNLSMEISETLKNYSGRIVGSEVIAMNGDSHNSIRLLNVETTENAEKNRILFKFSPSNLPTEGTYRLEAKAWLTGENQELINLSGTCWAYFL